MRAGWLGGGAMCRPLRDGDGRYARSSDDCVTFERQLHKEVVVRKYIVVNIHIYTRFHGRIQAAGYT